MHVSNASGRRVHVQQPKFSIWPQRMPCAGEGDVRLVGGDQDSTGNSASGLLEVFSSGAWGRVCRLSPGSFQAQTTPAPFTDAAAAVACRQLGFSSGTVAVDQVRGHGASK